MILRNYDNHIAMFQGTSSLGRSTSYNGSSITQEVTDYGEGSLKCKSITGSVGDCVISYEHALPFCHWSGGATTYNLSRLIIGDDNTAVSYNDYKLGNNITGKTTFVSQQIESCRLDITNNCIITNYKCVLMANEDITIKEIGVIYSDYNTQYLMYREVLETPIEVQANATVTMTFTKKVSVNPNKPADYVATASVE